MILVGDRAHDEPLTDCGAVYVFTAPVTVPRLKHDGSSKMTLSGIPSSTTSIKIKLNGRDYDTIVLATGHSVTSTIFYVYATGRYQAWFYDSTDAYITQSPEINVEVPSSAFPISVTENSSDDTKVDVIASFKTMEYDTIELLKDDYTSLSTPAKISHPINTLTETALDPGTYVLKFSNTTMSPPLGVYHEISAIDLADHGGGSVANVTDEHTITLDRKDRKDRLDDYEGNVEGNIEY